MKKLIVKTWKSVLALWMVALLFIACEKNPAVEPQADILPSQFGIDIPNSLSNQNPAGRIAGGRVSEDVLQGNDIYEHLATFVWVGESAAQIVDEVITAIRKHNIDRVLTLSYESDDDGRVKNLVVVENPEYDGVVYEYGLTITDAELENDHDGGYAMQIFWNREPVKGVAIIKPANLDVLHDADEGEAMVKIEYNSDSPLGYDAHMIVTIANLTLDEPTDNPYSMRSMKMFVGKSGNIIDVYGNSSHPNARFFTNDTGFNWAFVGSADEDAGLSVVEVGLPPNNLDSSDRDVILGDYSIKNVFTEQIYAAFPNITQDMIDLYLMNTAAPGYFTNEGFVAGGTPPSGLWQHLEPRLQDLTPYNPAMIANLQIDFQ